MSVRLSVRVVGNDADRAEVVAAREELNRYDLDEVDELIRNCVLRFLAEQAGLPPVRRLRAVEVCVWLNAEDEACRPSFHLSKETVHALAKAEASLDFDPYSD
jgi:hypothetical protein